MTLRILKASILIPLMFALGGCPSPPPAEDSCNFVQNSFNRRVSWSLLPIRFYIDDSLNADQVKGLQEAMDVWNREFTAPVFEILGQKDLPNPRVNDDGRVVPDGYNGVYVVDPDVFENTNFRDEQARTSISFRGDYIYEADMLIDGSELFYYSEAEARSSARRVQFKSLMVHELGHVLGLAHIEIPGVNSVMHPKLEYGQLRTTLDEVDVASIACEY